MADDIKRRRSTITRATTPTSARFLLRLPAGLHQTLQAAAIRAKLSLNEYCVRRLAVSGPALMLEESARAIVTRAAAVAGSALVGVVVYGSWMRGDAAVESDVDVLIVADRSLAITRALYRSWDAAPITWRGAAVDPHFAHLPDEGPPSGLWGEVAIDGVMLFERDLEFSSLLIRVRRDIAAGRLVRRIVHGQPYWTAAA